MDDAVLLLSSFIPTLVEGLRSRLTVQRWSDLIDAEEWLRTDGHRVRAVVTGGEIGISNDLMAKLPRLGVVAINGVGFDKVDLNFAQARGIRVSTTPDVLTDDVADLAVGLIIALLRGIAAGDRFVRAGQWARGPLPLQRRLTGRRFGIVGLGRIGQAIATRLAPYGPIAYTDTREKPVPYSFHANCQNLARACDVLVLSASANESTRDLVGRHVLEALGVEGFLVNVARGSLIDERELLSALEEQRIAGAALDVLAAEPSVPASLLAHPHVIVTPHIASATTETRLDMARLVLANIDAYLSGVPLPSALV